MSAALFDPDNNSNILNGNYSVSVFKKTMVYGGASIEYSGTAANVQRINSSLTLRKPLLVKVGYWRNEKCLPSVI